MGPGRRIIEINGRRFVAVDANQWLSERTESDGVEAVEHYGRPLIGSGMARFSDETQVENFVAEELAAINRAAEIASKGKPLGPMARRARRKRAIGKR